ncbi:flavodoxin [Proteiniphilum sp. X52]|uniref:flavodoxin n=1 Tax=Proteiniphilum sp. X52 TaxID=2382159 RepID=UPI000F09F73D|nr:flavodoxin [Proteiniphilum sp. X52]RNC65128.1 flavodoxin [Proteiniphilum sp. X52]
MKRIFLAVTGIILLAGSAYAQENDKRNTILSNALIVFFSATGTTAEAAQKLAHVTGGERYEIVPQTPYTSADLNWRDEESRSSREMGDPASRPAIQGKKENIDDYAIIFIGYPIWWDVAPRIVNTFIESHNLKGKTVIPFATSGSSAIDHSVAELKKTYPEIKWRTGKLLTHATEQAIREWVASEVE